MDSNQEVAPTQSHNSSSESDDWTLISPPPSSSSSSSSIDHVNDVEQVQRAIPRSDSPETRAPEDGLHEINLNERPGESEDAQTNRSGRSSVTGSDSVPAGFRAIDSNTSDGDNDESSVDSRRSSLSSMADEFPDFVHLKCDDGLPQHSAQTHAEVPVSKMELVASTSYDRKRVSLCAPDSNSQHKKLKLAQCEEEASTSEQQQLVMTGGSSRRSIQAKLDELSDHFTLPQHSPSSLVCIPSIELPDAIHWPSIKKIMAVLTIIILAKGCLPENSKSLRDSLDSLIDQIRGKSIPPKYYADLMSIHHELKICIERQSPKSFRKFLASNSKGTWESESYKMIDEKPKRGLVCYGHEAKWREKFNKLEQDWNMDLARMTREAKEVDQRQKIGERRFDYTFILNQMKYLDYLEHRRKRETQESIIENLKAENMKLVKRLKQTDTLQDIQRLVVNLESEVIKLQTENEALKQSLVEKAGPVYIRQAKEKEQLEKENKMLREFLLDINKAITWSLGKFNIHTVDASLDLDNFEVIKSQVSITRSYFFRLSDRVSKLLIDNESLKEQLRETHLQLKEVELSDSMILMKYENDQDNDTSSKALVVDNCMRNLIKLKERSELLDREVTRLRQNCGKNRELERSSDRNLNRTRLRQLFDRHISCKQLDRSQIRFGKQIGDGRACDKDIIDGSMFFSTESSSTIERANSLAIVNKRPSAKLIRPKKSIVESKDVKRLPSYIREAIRVPQVKMTSDLNKHTSTGVRLPPTPPSTSYFSDQALRQSTRITYDSKAAHLFSRLDDLKRNSRCNENLHPLKSPVDQFARVNVTGESMLSRSVFPNNSWFFKRAEKRRKFCQLAKNSASNLMASI